MNSSLTTAPPSPPVALFTTLKQFNQQYRTSAAMIDPTEAMRTRPSVSTLLEKYSLSLLFQSLHSLVMVQLSSLNSAASRMIGEDEDIPSQFRTKGYDEQVQILCDTLDYVLSSSEIYSFIMNSSSSTSSSSFSNVSNPRNSANSNDDAASTSPILTPETLVQLVTQAGAYSPNTRVRMVALRYLERLASGQVDFPKDTLPFDRSILYTANILNALCSRLSDTEPMVAEHTSNIIFALCGGKLLLERGMQPGIRREPRKSSTSAVTPENLNSLLRTLHCYLSSIVEDGTTMEDTSSIAYSTVETTDEPGIAEVRIYTLVARICSISETTFNSCVQTQLVDQFLSSLIPKDDENTPSDPLLATNIITLLPPFARSKSGFDLLLEKNILPYLLSWSGIGSPRDVHIDTTSMMITTNVQELQTDLFLGMYALDALANIYSEACTYQYSTVSPFLHKNLLPSLLFISQTLCKETSDETAPAAGMSALDSVLGADAYAVDVILHNKDMFREWIEFAVSSNKELVGVCYQSIANILRRAKTVVSHTSSPSPDILMSNTGENTNISSGTEHSMYDRYHHIFEFIGKYCGKRDTIDIVVASLMDPTVPRTRYAAYDLLISIVELPGTWGIRKVFGSSSLSGILLNRDSETTKEGKEWKYGIIVAALENPAIVTLGDEFRGKLQIYRDAGPYAAARTGPSVATESKTN